jgi:uncharacterized membrane protein YciS (DUF1049 family)
MRYLYTLFAVAGWSWLVVAGSYLAIRLSGARRGRLLKRPARQENELEHEEQC